MLTIKKAKEIITKEGTVFWFRRDLRLEDNAGLYHALKESKEVVPIFIFDTVILDQLEDKKDKRVAFIRESLSVLKEELEKKGSSLLVLYGNPTEIFEQLQPKAVYTNHDYEPYATKRDKKVRQLLEANGSSFNTFKDQVIFEKDEILKDDRQPYTVFTPYSKRWKATLNDFYIKPYPTARYSANLKKLDPQPIISLKEMGFEELPHAFPPRSIKTSIIEHYSEQRDYPAINGTTKLSVHLRFGTVSIRKLTKIAREKNETWLNELIWREFYQMILWHFPQVVNRSFKPSYDHIAWKKNEEDFKKWCEGKTGYPIVDAGMRELNETGFMHNRVRMIVASFLTKHLLIDWRWGEAYFAKKLLDYDLAANNGGWQWAAGTGCDAAPYFRVFNPELQTAKFDAEMKYIKKWVPELGTSAYPPPMIDHAFARDRALEVYKSGLSEVQS